VKISNFDIATVPVASNRSLTTSFNWKNQLPLLLSTPNCTPDLPRCTMFTELPGWEHEVRVVLSEEGHKDDEE
jgi:hypothetical protein